MISAAQHRVDLSLAKVSDLKGYYGIKFVSKDKKEKLKGKEKVDTVHKMDPVHKVEEKSYFVKGIKESYWPA